MKFTAAAVMSILLIGLIVLAMNMESPEKPEEMTADSFPKPSLAGFGPDGPQNPDSIFLPETDFPNPFPAIDQIDRVAASETEKLVDDDDLVLGVEINGEARAYPISMLSGPMRSVLNDTLGDAPIIVTWDETYLTPVVYARTVDNLELTFQASGKSWKKNLVIQDVETESLWNQLEGVAKSGQFINKKLRPIPSVLTNWANWKRQAPETTLLNLPQPEGTVYSFSFEKYKEKSHQLAFGMAPSSKPQVVKMEKLQKSPVFNSTLASEPIVLFLDEATMTVQAFKSQIDEKTIRFALDSGQIVDKSSGSLWDLRKGKCTSGQYQGTELEPVVLYPALLTYWKTFSPLSNFAAPNPAGN